MSSFSNIPFSVLDLSHILEGGTVADALHNSLALARHAEKLGFQRFWLAEHHNMMGIASAATSVVIGYVAGGTQKIRVGAGGIMLPNHAPLVIAEQFGTLESLYPGRIDLGLGRAPGSDGLTARALRRSLHTNGDDFPELLAELQFFLQAPVANQRVRAVPGAGLNIPIWLLSSSGFSARLAGELGLPFAFAAHFAPEYLLPALKIYRESFQPSANLTKPYAMVAVNVFAAETDAEAQKLATSQFQSFLNLIRGTPGKLQPATDDMEGLWSAPEKAAVESKLGGSIIGSAQTVREKLEKFLDATRADELMISAMIYDQTARLRSFEIVRDVWQNKAVARTV